MISEAKLNTEMSGFSVVRRSTWHPHSDFLRGAWSKYSHLWGGDLGACRLRLFPQGGKGTCLWSGMAIWVSVSSMSWLLEEFEDEGSLD